MIRPIIAALIMASCTASKPLYPTDTPSEKLWKQQYVSGQITWAEYQMRLQNEKH